MNLPAPGDYIDIHNHGGSASPGQFSVENLMAHENRRPGTNSGMTYTFGIHPWNLSAESYHQQVENVRLNAGHENVIALGEAGFDRLRGPGMDLQKKAFDDQVIIANENSKPMFIHCVKAWDELLTAHKRMVPFRPWIIHGFRGKKELAMQLISKDMYISFWFDFIIRPESTGLIRSLPADRIFLETDGSGEDIRKIYSKVANDLGIDTNSLKEQIFSNFKRLFDK